MLCRFDIVAAGEGVYHVRFRAGDEQPSAVPLNLELFKSTRMRDLSSRLEVGSCNNAELAELGTHLWNALRPGEIAARISSIRESHSISLAYPDHPDINRLPWEAMFDEQRSVYLATDLRRPFFRSLATNAVEVPRERSGPLKMLVVVPEGSQLDTTSELTRLRAAARKLGKQRIDIDVIDGVVTDDRIRNAVVPGYDIFHFIGHSRLNEVTGGIDVRINREDGDRERMLDANQFAALLVDSQVRLAVFNSCESAWTTAAHLSGLGRQLSLLAGIPAIIAMRYSIDDVSSTRFSDTFYRALFSLSTPGRVDYAMQKARDALYTGARPDSIRSFITPVLHLAEGGEQLFRPERLAELERPIIIGGDDREQIKVPKQMIELIKLIREGRCVPVIGTGLDPPAMRDALPVTPPTLLRLVTELASDGCYPDEKEIEFASEFAPYIYPRVFQYYVSENKRYKLVEWLHAHCAAESPSPVMSRIASWNAPGIVYTHFDGLMEEALKRGNRLYRPLDISHQSLASTSEVTPGVASSRLLLFNLRGTLSDEASLILTEVDHERLYDELAKASAEVSGLFKGALGRSVLLIGVSPMDPAVRRLARLFLDTRQSTSTQGPRYFVTTHASAGDRAYWKDFDVQWIDADPWRFVEAVDQKLRERER